MKKRILTSLIFLLFVGYSFAQLPGKPPAAPIDGYQGVLIVVAVLLTVGAIVYRKLSLKKA